MGSPVKNRCCRRCPAYTDAFSFFRAAQRHALVLVVTHSGTTRAQLHLQLELELELELKEYVEDGPLLPEGVVVPPMCTEEAREKFIDCIRGLHHLHLNGVVHGDIKPQNLLVAKNRKVKIADFGAAVMLQNQVSDVWLELLPIGVVVVSSFSLFCRSVLCFVIQRLTAVNSVAAAAVVVGWWRCKLSVGWLVGWLTQTKKGIF